MVVLDTDVLSIVQRASGDAYKRLLAGLDSAPIQAVYITIISFEEQLRGWLALIGIAKSPEKQILAYGKLRELLDDFQSRPILDFEKRAALIFRGLVKQRIRIGTMDLKIAAICLAHGATLISENLKDFHKFRGCECKA